MNKENFQNMKACVISWCQDQTLPTNLLGAAYKTWSSLDLFLPIKKKKATSIKTNEFCQKKAWTGTFYSP